MRSPRLARRIVLAVLIATLAVTAPGSVRAARTPTAAAAPARTATLAGTVGATNATAVTFDLVTGVGHALRVFRIHVPVPSAARGAAAHPALPARGSIVRVVCTYTPAGWVAASVEVLQAAPARMP